MMTGNVYRSIWTPSTRGRRSAGTILHFFDRALVGTTAEVGKRLAGQTRTSLLQPQPLGADIFPAMPTKPAAKKPIPGKTQVIKPAQKNTAQKKPVPDKGQGLRALKRVLHLSPAQKKPASDKVEHLVRKYLAGLREVDVTFENGAAVVEKYRSKYPELSNHIRRIAPEERRIEITQNLGEDADLRLFVIRILDDNAQYEVTLSKDEEHKTVKSSEWLFLLHDMLARIIAKILYARETSKEESREDVN